MTKQAIIEHTIDVINRLPDEKAMEVADFADFLMKQHEESGFDEDVNSLASGQSFAFLHDEEDLYTKDDLKETYGKR